MIKFPQRIGLEVTHLNITKVIDDKSVTNILPNGELQAFLLKTGLLLSPLLFRIVTETLTSTKDKSRKLKQKRGKSSEIIIVCRMHILYRTDYKYFTRKLLEMTNSFSKQNQAT